MSTGTIVGLLAIVPEVTVRQDPPPAPGGMFSLLAVLCALLIAFTVARRMLRGKRGSTLLFAGTVSVGNALMEFASMLQPGRATVESIEKAESPELNEAHDEAIGDRRTPRSRPGADRR
ncbi:MAG: hypothetical protein JKY37_29585 [Nannocystaceae bacterium]|nr:hypothetical protein [Nannocystaceae bacterium]